MTKDLKVLAASEIRDKRLELYKKQSKTCPICGHKITFEKAVLDHQHKLLKSDKLGVDGVGQIRGVLCFQCNSWEGKIFNAFRRYGLHKFKIPLPILLRNLADYLELENLPLIHPSEIKVKIVSKQNYNKLKKMYFGAGCTKKFPEYPKSKKLTKSLSILFKDFNIDPYNDKKCLLKKS